MGSAEGDFMTDGDSSEQGENVFRFDELKQKRGQQRANSSLPRLFVDKANPDKVVADLKAALALSGEAFDRGVLVRVGDDPNAGGVSAYALDADGFIVAAHRVCRPYKREEGVEYATQTVPNNQRRIKAFGQDSMAFGTEQDGRLMLKTMLTQTTSATIGGKLHEVDYATRLRSFII